MAADADPAKFEIAVAEMDDRIVNV